MTEEWKDIPGYEGLYQASTLGQIRTCEGKVTSSARFPRRVWKQRVMKQKCTMNQKGRYDCRVELWKDGTHKTWLVSRLVALTWCEGFKDGMTVNHIDGNSLNNSAENLEWICLGDNIRHGFETGLYSTSKKCVLISEDGDRKEFMSQAQASKSLGKNDHYIANKLYYGKTICLVDGKIYRIEMC